MTFLPGPAPFARRWFFRLFVCSVAGWACHSPPTRPSHPKPLRVPAPPPGREVPPDAAPPALQPIDTVGERRCPAPEFSWPAKFHRTPSPPEVSGRDACVWWALKQASPDTALLEESCLAGSGRACLDRGLLFLAGSLDTADMPAAVAWFRRGCDREDAYACERLASHTLSGLGVPRNVEEGRRLFASSCQRGMRLTCPLADAAALANPRFLCGSDEECVLSGGSPCPSVCGDCQLYPLTYAVNRRWVRDIVKRCAKGRGARNPRGKGRGYRGPSCGPCLAPKLEPPPLQPKHAVCSEGLCLAI